MVDIQTANEKQVGGGHYRRSGGIQHWDMIDDNGIGYLEGNATKYLDRWRHKNGLQDLEKALHYCEKTIENAEAKNRRPKGVVPWSTLKEYFAARDHNATEQAAITALLRWENVTDLYQAKRHIMALIASAPVSQ